MLFRRAIIKRDLVANEEYSNIDDVYPHKRFASGDEEPINASLNDNNSVKKSRIPVWEKKVFEDRSWNLSNDKQN